MTHDATADDVAPGDASSSAAADAVDELHEDEKVVEALVELGVSHEEAVRAVDDGAVPLILAAQALDEPVRYRLDDLVEASGISRDVLRELFSAMGDDAQGYTQSDLEAAHLFAQLLEVLPLEALLSSARARAIALSAIVRSDMSTVRDHIMVPLREAGADDLTIAVALAGHATEFDRISRRLLVHDYQRRMRTLLRSELSLLAARSDRPAVEVCVGFVDLVGYTALAARVDPTGLDELLDTFERRVFDAASTEPDVTVVKFLGDAAMLVSSDLAPLVNVLLPLTIPSEDLDGEQEMPIRGGIARGDVLLREGDYFGNAVNLAARLTDLARPWSLLADDDLREDLGALYELRRIRPVLVRGVGTRRPVAIRAPFDVDGAPSSIRRPPPAASGDSATSPDV